MGRKILFVTTDQQRYDTLGCNGGALARTPVVDALAAQGHRYARAQPQSVVCAPLPVMLQPNATVPPVTFVPYNA